MIRMNVFQLDVVEMSFLLLSLDPTDDEQWTE